MLRAVCHSAESGWSEVTDFDRVSDLRTKPGHLVWAEADLKDLTPEAIARIAEEFDLHQLAIEDAQHPVQRPKIESFGEQLFLVVYQIDDIPRDSGGSGDEPAPTHLRPRQIACFIGDSWLLILHDGAARLLDEVSRRRRALDRDPSLDRSALLYLLVDAAVDDYETIAAELYSAIEAIEDHVMSAAAEGTLDAQRAKVSARNQREIYRLKQGLARLRRFALPASDIVNGYGQHVPEMPDEIATRWRDVADHLHRLGDQVHSMDELAAALLAFNQLEQNRHLSVVMKKLTAWAAIIAVPTFVASVYGMNFALVPSEGELLGFWFANAVMVASAAILYALFKRKDWL